MPDNKKPITPPQAPNTPSPTASKPAAGKPTGRRGTTGVWVHYRKTDDIVMVQSLHADQLDAATAALDAETTGNRIAFVMWGENIADVIK